MPETATTQSSAKTTSSPQNKRQHLDDIAVDAFALAMKEKLRHAREQKGRGGWPSCSATYLSDLLREHVEKGDPVDVANLAMMLYMNGHQIEAKNTQDVTAIADLVLPSFQLPAGLSAKLTSSQFNVMVAFVRKEQAKAVLQDRERQHRLVGHVSSVDPDTGKTEIALDVRLPLGALLYAVEPYQAE